ncbi:MAG TPA: Matrixin, partial [Armatimonadota bacterium]|nr:Matrixin [Armatimonadota bacterium]
ESVRTEQAAAADLYRGLAGNRTEGHLLLVRPRESRSPDVFHAYYVHAIRPNGVTLNGSHELIFVKETAELFQVPGGIDEPLPRVTAHEIGHALALEHRQDRVNLMASGTTGTSLNEAEIQLARRTARGFSWHLDPAQALERARKEPEPDRGTAAALYRVLAALPDGAISREARKHVD